LVVLKVDLQGNVLLVLQWAHSVVQVLVLHLELKLVLLEVRWELPLELVLAFSADYSADPKVT
tara:strand:+ start:70 stop:258 length:189 start_codon:yes stop_codon:yes gene_type:complete